jgi:hypothetical protein
LKIEFEKKSRLEINLEHVGLIFVRMLSGKYSTAFVRVNYDIDQKTMKIRQVE